MTEMNEAYEKGLAVRVWRHNPPREPLRCPYEDDHTTIGVVNVDGETLLHCPDCDVAIGPVPDYVMEFYRGYVKLGWIKPLPPPEVRER